MGSNTVIKTTIGRNSFQIDSSGGTGDSYGILGGSVNGSNTTFTVSLGSYITGSLEISLNGQVQTQGSAEDWVETTPASGTFDFNIAPEAGDIIIVKYQYQTVNTGNADTLDGHHSTDFITNTVAGEFENKIIDGDLNTITDLPYSAIKSTSRSGSDTKLITGTVGTDGDLAKWNADGDLIDGPTPPSGTIVGTTDTQTLTNKTLTSPLITGTWDGWISAGETWTYASATTITVPSGAASKYRKGMPFKLTANSVELQGYIIGVADTTLTVFGDTLTNHTFINNFYAHSGTNPVGFDGYFTYTPTVSCEGSMTYTSVSVRLCRVSIAGNDVHLELDVSGTTGGTASTGIYLSLPVTPISDYGRPPCTIYDTSSIGVGYTILSKTNKQILVRKSDTSNWALGSSRIICLDITYGY